MYCTIENLKGKISEAHLIQLTDDEDLGVMDTVVVNGAIADATAEIDSYCSGRYSVPLSPVPSIIVKYAKDIAIYNLYQRRSGADEDRQRDYDNAVKFLIKVSEGKANLGVQPPPDPPADDAATGANVATRDKLFTPDLMDKF